MKSPPPSPRNGRERPPRNGRERPPGGEGFLGVLPHLLQDGNDADERQLDVVGLTCGAPLRGGGGSSQQHITVWVCVSNVASPNRTSVAGGNTHNKLKSMNKKLQCLHCIASLHFAFCILCVFVVKKLQTKIRLTILFFPICCCYPSDECHITHHRGRF